MTQPSGYPICRKKSSQRLVQHDRCMGQARSGEEQRSNRIFMRVTAAVVAAIAAEEFMIIT